MHQKKLQHKVEQNVLGAIFLSDDYQIDYILGELKIKDFTEAQNQNLFIVLSDIWTTYRKIDTLKVFEYIKDKNIHISETLIYEVVEVGSSTNVELHVKWLQEKSYFRNIIGELQKFQQKVIKSELAVDIEKEKQILINALTDTTYTNETDTVDWKKEQEILVEHIKSKKQLAGLSWKIDVVDGILGGMERKFYIVGGLKKGGKSRFMIHIAKAIHNQQETVGIIEIEMGSQETHRLIMSTFTGIPDFYFKVTGKLSEEQKKTVEEKFKDISWDLLKLKVCHGIDRNQLRNKIRELHKLGCKYVLVDFIQRVVPLSDNETQEITRTSNMLADLSRQLDIGIIALAQLTNLAEKERPRIHHLKGSGGMAEAADGIIIIENVYRRTKKDDDKGKFFFDIEQRGGDAGLVELRASLANCRFYDIPSPPPSVGETTSSTEAEVKPEDNELPF